MRNKEELLQKAREYAFLLLKFRLRSEKEIYSRLKQKKFAEEIHEEPKEGDIVVIVNPNRNEDEPEVHFGIFVDNYKRFFHLHKGNGIISNLSNIKRTFYLYKLKR